jgi:cytochrome b561
MSAVAPGYTRTAIALHWTAAVLILGGFVLGLWMTGLEISPRKFRAYAWHKWIGITVFLIALARLAWRAGHPAPAPVAMAEWQRRAASATHAMLYALMLAAPITGYLYSSASGVQVVYLGLLPLPDLVAKDKELASMLKVTHLSLVFTLAALVVVHAAAAIKHHVVDRDGVLARMLPLVRSGS